MAKYNIALSSTDYDLVLNDKDIDLVMITTRHNLHAEMVIKALDKGKHVFVEKPLALRMINWLILKSHTKIIMEL